MQRCSAAAESVLCVWALETLADPLRGFEQMERQGGRAVSAGTTRADTDARVRAKGYAKLRIRRLELSLADMDGALARSRSRDQGRGHQAETVRQTARAAVHADGGGAAGETQAASSEAERDGMRRVRGARVRHGRNQAHSDGPDAETEAQTEWGGVRLARRGLQASRRMSGCDGMCWTLVMQVDRFWRVSWG